MNFFSVPLLFVVTFGGVPWIDQNGCRVHQDEIPAIVSSDCDNKDIIPYLESAVKIWNSSIGFDIFKIDSCGNGVVFSHATVVKDFEQLKTFEGSAITNWSHSNWHINNANTVLGPGWIEWSDDSRVIIILHELGHTLGLDHNASNESCIMFPRSTIQMKPCEEEVLALREVYYP